MSDADAISPGPGQPVPKSTLRRAIAASAIGNATEWFDYGIYAYGVTYISAALFPGEAERATLFAGGAVAREHDLLALLLHDLRARVGAARLRGAAREDVRDAEEHERDDDEHDGRTLLHVQ